MYEEYKEELEQKLDSDYEGEGDAECEGGKETEI